MSLANRIARRERRRRVARKLRDGRVRTMTPRGFGSLMGLVPELRPGFREPDHLGPMFDGLERVRAWARARREGEWLAPLRLLYATPPGHFKSSSLHTFVAGLLAEDPTLRIGYGTYDGDFAAENVAEIRKLVSPGDAGDELARDEEPPPTMQVPIGNVDRAGYFTTAAGGCVMGFGLLAPPMGRRFHLVIVDDPYRSRQEAESRAIREKVVRGVRSDLMSRQVAGGSCFIIIHTRWHVDDLIGVLTRRKGAWEYRNLPALKEDGTPLAPDVWSLEMLEEVRAESEYDWWSLYMGQPRAPGGTVFFDGPALYDRLEESGAYLYSIGIDLSRSAKEKSDPHAYAVLRRKADDPSRTPVVDVVEVHEEVGPISDVDQGGRRIPGFLRHLVRLAKAYPGARFVMYVGRAEENMLGLIATLAVKIAPMDARLVGPKYRRAEAGYAPAWNGGRVRLPRVAPWVGPTITEHTTWTGLEGERDNRIDACVAAYDDLATGRKLPVKWKSKTQAEGSESERMGKYV